MAAGGKDIVFTTTAGGKLRLNGVDIQDASSLRGPTGPKGEAGVAGAQGVKGTSSRTASRQNALIDFIPFPYKVQTIRK